MGAGRAGIRAPAGLLAAVLWLTGPSGAAAQVNAEHFRGTADGEGVTGAVELAFANRTGNTDLMEGGATVRVGWRGGPRMALFVSDLSVGTARDETTINRGFAHLRGGRDLTPRLMWEGFLQHEYDRFANLVARSLVGTGPRITVYRGEAVGAFWGVAYMLERERLDVPAGGPDPAHSRVHRLSSYLALNVDLTDRLAFVNTVYVQPRVAEVRDTRVLEEASLKVGMAGPWSLKVSFTLRYDGDPPADVKYVDTALSNRLVLEF